MNEASRGRIVAIGIAREASAAMESLQEVEIVAGVGIPGDRYAEGGGTWKDSPDRELTLVEVEAARALGFPDALAFRRNIITEGVRLEGLIGRRFTLGTALLEGVRPCDPCSYLERCVSPGLKEALAGRGGLRAKVLRSGEARIGDPIDLAEDQTA